MQRNGSQEWVAVRFTCSNGTVKPRPHELPSCLPLIWKKRNVRLFLLCQCSHGQSGLTVNQDLLKLVYEVVSADALFCFFHMMSTADVTSLNKLILILTLYWYLHYTLILYSLYSLFSSLLPSSPLTRQASISSLSSCTRSCSNYWLVSSMRMCCYLQRSNTACTYTLAWQLANNNG